MLTFHAVESCFERAKEVIPERWYSRPEMMKDKRAFAPFALDSSPCQLFASETY